MSKAIIITGTPGTGKKSLGKDLAKRLGYRFLSGKEFIEKNKGVIIGRDRKNKCDIVDVKKLAKKLENYIKKSKEKLVIASHLSHNIDKKYVELCIVTRCPPKVLERRLKKRGYSKEKIRENVEAEILDVCLIETLEKGHKVHEVLTNGSKKNTLTHALKGIKNPKYGFVSWLK